MARSIQRIKPFIKILKEDHSSFLHVLMKVVLKDKFDEILDQLIGVWEKNPVLRFTKLIIK